MMNDITLREAALELGVNKSKLHYYVSMGLLEPKSVVSGTFLFNRNKISRDIKRIGSLRKRKYSLSEIKEIMQEK